MFKRSTGAQHPDPEAEFDDKKRRIWRRIHKLGTSQLLDYIDTAGAGMARGITDFRKEGEIDSLREIDDSLLVLKVIVEELIIRCETEG